MVVPSPHTWRSAQHATSHNLGGSPGLLRIRDRYHCTLGLGELVSMLYLLLAGVQGIFQADARLTVCSCPTESKCQDLHRYFTTTFASVDVGDGFGDVVELVGRHFELVFFFTRCE